MERRRRGREAARRASGGTEAALQKPQCRPTLRSVLEVPGVIRADPHLSLPLSRVASVVAFAAGRAGSLRPTRRTEDAHGHRESAEPDNRPLHREPDLQPHGRQCSERSLIGDRELTQLLDPCTILGTLDFIQGRELRVLVLQHADLGGDPRRQVE